MSLAPNIHFSDAVVKGDFRYENDWLNFCLGQDKRGNEKLQNSVFLFLYSDSISINSHHDSF